MKKKIETVCGVVSAIALFSIMALTFFDVGARKLLSNSIPGSLEMTELLMVLVIFAALPLVSLKGEHVVFDSLDGFLKPAFQKIQRAMVHVLCAAAMLGLAWLMSSTGSDFQGSGETTAQLHIPKHPFIYGMSVMCALTGVIHALLAFYPERDLEEHEGAAL